ncbi:hypothetical protein D6825_02655 [Candidatus Woesearchaeota archaeon]|nr:MAG: hypothetical protein D6825_02655 [Candidatus Woesearchaeota archaeon]
MSGQGLRLGRKGSESAELSKLFRDERKVSELVRELAQGVLDLSDFVLAKSAVELAAAQVAGKRLADACTRVEDLIHEVKKDLGVLLLSYESVEFKGIERPLHEMEDSVSLIHGDLDALRVIAQNFHKAKDRKVAFANASKHYRALVKHIVRLLVEENELFEVLG